MTPTPPSRKSVGIEMATAVAATLAGLALIVVFIGSANALWRDEVSSVNTQAAASWGEMWQRAEFESFPALWMILLRGWLTVAGGSDSSLRIFGALGMLALVAAIWFATRRLARIPPVLSLSLIVLTPEIFRWGATVRPWGLGAALAVATIPLVWDATIAPSRNRILIAAGVAILSVQCLFQNAVFLLAVAASCILAAGVRATWRQRMVPTGIGIAAAISLIPYTGLINRRTAWNELGAASIDLGDIARQIWGVISSAGAAHPVAWLAGVLAVLLVATTAFGGPDMPNRRAISPTTRYVLLLMTFATVGLVVFYLSLGYPTQSWYYLGLLAIYAVCSEVVIASILSARQRRIWISGAALVLVATGVPAAWPRAREPLTNIDVIAERLTTEVRAGDVITLNPWFLGVPFSRYYRGTATVASIPPISDPTISRYDLLKRAMLTRDTLQPVLSSLLKALESGHRVWVVGNLRPPPGPRQPPLPLPPLPDSGWNSLPYELAWEWETSAFLRDHAVEEPIAIKQGGRLENPSLRVFRAR